MDKMKMMKEMSGMVKGGHGKNPGHGGHGGPGSHGQMNDSKAMKEAMKLAKTKDIKQIDPAVLDYAATKLQAGFRGYKTRKNLNK